MNNPFDTSEPVQLLIEPQIESRAYMESIRAFRVPADSLAVWFFGQNGFILKTSESPLLGIDLYLTDSCAQAFSHLPFRVNRQLPVFVEPEDLDLDIFVTTHSHDDHADLETIRRFSRRDKAIFVGPLQSVQRYKECGVPERACRLLHAAEKLELGKGVSITGTFALPTDATDLNHIGVLVRFDNGITFYDTGDTAWCDLLPGLLPSGPDICAVCINGGYHNLNHMQAAHVIAAVKPRVAVPCHYDMMINNIADPRMLEVSLRVLGDATPVEILPYYEPWIYTRDSGNGAA
ncbi:MAG TPA: MBL fold metallo-hydrolase [Bryobacteraceae bacterium]|jgi:L-ascorbate 6-phosphate lactonase|nr:MBL fold metallo-hydrolase [Bryobacteraceae bacterium]